MTNWIGKGGLAAIALTAASLFADPALAGGGVGVTFGFSSPPPPYHGYYHRPAPYYYGPPPVYYRGPPVYVPPPVYVAPPAYYAPPAYIERAPAAAPGYDRGNCREYQSTATVNGAIVPTYGTACQQPDGSWRMIN